jgi:hypothetical protein
MKTLSNNKIQEQVLAYLNKTAKHLFITEGNRFYKVVPFKKDDSWKFMTIMFDGETTKVTEYDVDTQIRYYGNDTKNVISNIIFDFWLGKMTAIKNFKEMKSRMYEVYKAAGDKEKIGEILKGLTPK